MQKGISFYYGFNTDAKTRAQNIKNAGFDCIITSPDPRFNKQNGTLKKQVGYFKKFGIKHSSLHMQYSTNLLPYFWQDCKLGNKLEKTLKKDVLIAKKYGFKCVVVHLSGTPNQIGYNRLNRVLKVCEKVNIPLAIENINDPNCFFKTFENIKNDYLLFCYDSGHNNAFDPETDYLTLFADKLICLHLHDNYGKDATEEQLKKVNVIPFNLDMHTINKYGTINWNIIAKKLANVPREINLDYEILMRARTTETEQDVLQIVYKQACQLEAMIQKYKTKKS